MRKIGVIVFVVLCLFFCQAEIATAGVHLCFDYQDGKVSQEYVEFSNEFGSQLLGKVQKYSFKDDYTVKVEEGFGAIRYKDGKIVEEMVIVVVINDEEDKSLWVKVKNLSSSGRIKEKAKEFSEKVFQRLLQMERERPAAKKVCV